mmetsp:Transcript_20165/g.41554  ORF Transcript_20165/g.41554 Transcript_20165/m.41554 type:complete len:169 (-) Transcript_20165:418-924(-)
MACLAFDCLIVEWVVQWRLEQFHSENVPVDCAMQCSVCTFAVIFLVSVEVGLPFRKRSWLLLSECIAFGIKFIDVECIDQRRLLRIALSEDPSLDAEDSGNGSSGSKGSFSPRTLPFLAITSEDLRALPGLCCAGKRNFPKKRPSTTHANSSMLNVIAMSISNHPKSC